MRIRYAPARTRPALSFVLFLLLAFAPAAQAQNGGAPQESIYPDLEGQELRDALRTEYAPNQTLGYGPARDSLYRYEQRTDSALTGAYTGFSIQLDPNVDASADADEKGINAEHTLPQSMGAGSEPIRSDLHNLFPTKKNVNSARGNTPFEDIADDQTETWYYQSEERSAPPPLDERDLYSEDASGRFEPREDHKGNAARAVMYMRAVYPNSVDNSFFEEQRETLLAWNGSDEVGAEEYARSSWIATRQGTANPFVLDTTLARRAFGEPAGGEGDRERALDPGLLVVTELMANPDDVDDIEGEYFEVYNRSTEGIDLDGLTVSDAGSDEFTIGPGGTVGEASTTVPSGQFYVFCLNAAAAENGGVACDYDYEDFALANGDDELFIGGESPAAVFALAYDDGDPFGAGVASELTSTEEAADGEAAGSDYQAAAQSIDDEGSDQGSPGAAGTTEASVLPVEFAGAPTARTSGASVTLSWTTLSEENNLGFYVQYRPRPDGKTGPPGWMTARRRVEGAGSSTSERTYRYRVTGLAARRYAFRVKQVDTDGEVSFSPTTEVDVGLARFALQAPSQNPFHDRTTLTYSAPEAEHLRAVLYNSLGQEVRRLRPAGGRVTVSAGGLASGLYFVRLTTGDGRMEVQPVTLVR